MSSHEQGSSPRLLVGLLVPIGRELRLARYALAGCAAPSTRPDAMRATVAINAESLGIPSRTEDALATLAEVSRKVTEASLLAAAMGGAENDPNTTPAQSVDLPHQRPEDALERAAKAIGADVRAVEAVRAALLVLDLDVAAAPLVLVAELLVVVMRLRGGALPSGRESP